ncbi:MAG: M48 family metalloprotease [Candidatus Korobacteraceae bacterium]
MSAHPIHRGLLAHRLRRATKSAVVASLLLATAAAAPGPTQFKPGFNLFTRQQDVQLGQEAAAQIRQNVTIVHDPVLTAYVHSVTQRLMASPEAKASGFSFTFQIVANPAINAYALPGGPMFINTGLLREVANEAQFAGAIAHEMSHVILRHGTNQASKVDLIQLPVALAGQLTNSDTLMGQLAQLGIGLGANSVLLKFNRIHESQADLMGAHIMAEAGYDPIQLARFFVRLNDQSGAFVFLSDHPNPGDRSRAIKEEAARLPYRNYAYQTGRFQEMKRAVANIHEPPPQPQAEENSSPSATPIH